MDATNIEIAYNTFVVRRSAAVTALLLIALAIVPSINVCSGWMSSASERMACCDHSRGGHTQEMADTCCANGESQQNAEWLGLFGFALPTPQPPALHLGSIVPVPPHAVAPVDSHEPLTSDSERHVLLSVFLI